MEVEGGKVWYGILGEGDNTPLLVMHGGPGSTSRSFYQYSSIAQDRPIIMFDQLGSGRSDYHEDTSLLKVENFVEQVETLKNELGLTEFYVLGHSWGSALELEFYLAPPKGIKGLIFSSPYFSTPIWVQMPTHLSAHCLIRFSLPSKKGRRLATFCRKNICRLMMFMQRTLA